MRSLQTQRGFTLIEIIVVVVILGLIAAIALSRFIDIKDDANDSVIAAIKGAFLIPITPTLHVLLCFI